MPDDIVHACHEGDGVDAQAMHGYQSVWMAHWMHTSYESAATPARNPLSIDCQFKGDVKEDSGAEKHDLLGGKEVAVDSSTNAGEFGEAARDTRVTFMNEVDPGKSKKACCGSESFPMLNLSQKTGGMLSLKREQNVIFHGKDKKCETEASSGDDNVSFNKFGSHVPSISAHAPPKAENLVRECQILSEGILPTDLLLKSPDAVEQNKLVVSTSLWNDFVKSASGIVPNEHDRGKTLMPSSTHGQHEIYQSSYNLASQERFTSTQYHSYSSLSIREKKMSSLLDLQRSSFSRGMQGGIAHLPHDPIAGSDGGLYFFRGQHHKMQNYTPNANITNQTGSLESTKQQNFYGGSSLVSQLPCSVHDAETMKIYTNIDSVQESSRGHPKVSLTSHHFLMSKKTDVNLSARGQFSRVSTAPTKFKGNAFHDIPDFSPPMSDDALEGVKLEALGSSMKSEGKENVQDLKTPTGLKNESSAETDTLYINALQENHLPGNVPVSTNKCSKDDQKSPSSQVATTSAGKKATAKSVHTSLPEINQEPPELPTQASQVVDRETSTSRTHSLDVEHLYSHADEHAKSKSNACGNSSLGLEPNSRWIKRLKLCTLGSALGTKSAKIGETSSHEKINNIFGKIMKDSKTSLESKMECHAEGQMVPGLPATILTNNMSSFTKAKQTVDIMLSHPWIQRWSHNRAASSQKKHELVELRDPKSSIFVLEEFQKKQFPSIAAMALMGKAMNSLNPCELVKKGPLIVWNTKGF